MALTELILGATRASQLLLSVITVGLTSASVHSLTKNNIGGHAVNYFSLFTSVFGLLSLIFLVTSQFIFVHRYDGYNMYISTGVAVESLNWLFLFASWISLAQFGNSPNCHAALAFHKSFIKTCTLDRAVLGFMVLLWFTWSISLIVMVRLKLNEAQERANTKEIEMRIKTAVELQAREANSASNNSSTARPGIAGTRNSNNHDEVISRGEKEGSS